MLFRSTLRDNGTLAYTQISHKTYYKPEDVMAIVAVVEDRKKDMRHPVTSRMLRGYV